MRTLILTVLSLVLFYGLPAEGRSLTTEEVKVIDVPGAFSLILYGGRYFSDVETVAILDLEGDQYTLEPFAPEFDYRIKKGLQAGEALHDAEAFISRHHLFSHSQLVKILDGKGSTVGYELRPLYRPHAFGDFDLIDVDYWLKDGRIKVTVRVKPHVERQLHDRDMSIDRGD